MKTVFFDLGDTLVKIPKIWLPGAQSLLTRLKQGGVRLGIISNTGNLPDRKAILELLPSDFDLSMFDPMLVLFSSEVGIAKPDIRLFEIAIAAAHTPASDCLYCSESTVETIVAQKAGMRAIRVCLCAENDLASVEEAVKTL